MSTMSKNAENFSNEEVLQEEFMTTADKLLRIAKSTIENFCDDVYEEEIDSTEDVDEFFFTFKIVKVQQQNLTPVENFVDAEKMCVEGIDELQDIVKVEIFSEDDVQQMIDTTDNLFAQGFITEEVHQDIRATYCSKDSIFVKISGEKKYVRDILLRIVYQIAARLKKVKYGGSMCIVAAEMDGSVMVPYEKDKYETGPDSTTSI